MRESQGNMSERRLSHQFPFPKIIVHLLNKQKKQQISKSSRQVKITSKQPLPPQTWGGYAWSEQIEFHQLALRYYAILIYLFIYLNAGIQG